MVVSSRKEHGSRGRARLRRVEVGQANAIFGQPIKDRGFNLGTIRFRVTEAKVISYYDEKVWSFGYSHGSVES